MSLPSREEHGLREFGNRALRRKFGPKGDEMVGGWRNLHNEELRKFFSWPNIMRTFKSQRKSFAWHVARMGRRGMRSGKTPSGRSRSMWNDNIKTDLREVHRIAGVLDFIHRPDFTSYKKKEE
jgi:hypothetical protein